MAGVEHAMSNFLEPLILIGIIVIMGMMAEKSLHRLFKR